MRILITGITGFAGSHLADHILHQGGVEIHGIKRWRSSLDNIKGILDCVILHDADLTDAFGVLKVIEQVRPDKIFHLAAQSFVPYSYDNPSVTLDTNIIGTANLLEAIRKVGIDPLIHICSSSEVYGQPEYTPMDETHPTNPISPYGVSKLAEEKLAWAYYKAYGIRVVITRAFTHTGARQHSALVISSIAKQIAEGKDRITLGNISSLRTIASVKDIVRGYYLINDKMVGKAYNIGGNTTRSIKEIVEMFGDYQIQVDPNLIRPTDVTLQIPDCREFQDATGWQCEVPIRETLDDILNYWKERV